MKRIIVVGAGASGMLAAITAARQGAAVTVLEHMDRPGKKLLLTGSGRCNLTNLHQSEDCYRGADQMFLKCVLDQFPVSKTLAFFREIGLLTTARDTYIYPVTGQASSVLEVLQLEMRRLGIKVKCRENVTGIRAENDAFLVETDSWKYEAEAVILCAGSKAAPVTGSDGSGYALAKLCGHTVKEPLPALVPLKIRESWIRKFSGVRMPAKITLQWGASKTCTEEGELQWTDYGISGIAVFQLSRYAVRALADRKKVTVCLDLLPSLDESELFHYLRTRRTGMTAAELFAGILPRKIISPLLADAGIEASVRAEKLTDAQLEKLTRAIKQMRLTVCGSKSFAQAQSCQGGIPAEEVCAKTLQSRRMPGLYLAGELLDVDGSCGGYNLQWAWASGYVAGMHAAKICELSDK